MLQWKWIKIINQTKKTKMKLLLLTLVTVLTATVAFGQHYKTLGAEQYAKNINGQYVLTGRDLNYDASWTFLSDNTFTCFRDGSNSGNYKITKKVKAGNKTTYTISLYGMMEIKLIVEGNKLTWLEGADNETKIVYRIIKVEKAD